MEGEEERGMGRAFLGSHSLVIPSAFSAVSLSDVLRWTEKIKVASENSDILRREV
jgi:hypothetical protein